MCHSNPHQGVPSATVTGSHVTQGRVEYESTIPQVMDEGLDLWEAISRDSNNCKLKVHYKSYCLILSKVIKAAKQLYYNSKISMFNNKINTTWDIIKMETCKNHTNKGTQLINIDRKLITNQQSITNSFNNYFLTVADKVTNNIKNDKHF